LLKKAFDAVRTQNWPLTSQWCVCWLNFLFKLLLIVPAVIVCLQGLVYSEQHDILFLAWH